MSDIGFCCIQRRKVTIILYKDAITTLTKLKVIDGYEDGTFKPDGSNHKS